ncbi:DUF302 domain-containing protein [Roseospira goensis]|uniref:Uncharacterized protein (DUF302 family) n=1 Tax=Roseospira goensis TaxID=391922 RepID=A0A7W6RY22_9PROT|nr:DUF302 domain-containing protein [Roseospira goensis]MBB4285351.1 uncharacterized protein (DUF302 family) [Roseospira goensis]
MILHRRALAPLALAGVLFAATVTTSPAVAAGDGLVRLQSPHSVDVTLQRLKDAITAKGVTIFAEVNHAEGAAGVGKALLPTQLLVFGSPKIGAPLMTEARTIGIDLPLKALVYEDVDGQVWLAYNDPAWLAARHGLAPDLAPFQGMTQAIEGFAAAAVTE